MKTEKTIKSVVLILSVLILAVIVSCATVGRDFPTDAVSKIQIGKMTKEDISRLFGSPWRTGIEDGNKTWTYGYYKYRLLGQSLTRDLVIRYGADGKVVSYTFNTTEAEKE